MLNILVPYKNSITNAHEEVIYYENFNDCEYARTIHCEAYTADVDFDKSVKEGFYGLQVKRFGTIYSDTREKIMPVDQWLSYQFVNGSYLAVKQSGEDYTQQDDHAKQVLRYCYKPRKISEIGLLLGLKDRDIFYDYLRPLIDKEFITLTIPNQPKNPLQKYVLTHLGKKWLQENFIDI